MSTINVLLQGGLPVNVSEITEAGNDVQLVDANGRNVDAVQVCLSSGTDGTINYRSSFNATLRTIKFVSEGWHTDGIKMGFISHTSTDTGLGILVQ